MPLVRAVAPCALPLVRSTLCDLLPHVAHPHELAAACGDSCHAAELAQLEDRVDESLGLLEIVGADRGGTAHALGAEVRVLALEGGAEQVVVAEESAQPRPHGAARYLVGRADVGLLAHAMLAHDAVDEIEMVFEAARQILEGKADASVRQELVAAVQLRERLFDDGYRAVTRVDVGRVCGLELAVAGDLIVDDDSAPLAILEETDRVHPKTLVRVPEQPLHQPSPRLHHRNRVEQLQVAQAAPILHQ